MLTLNRSSGVPYQRGGPTESRRTGANLAPAGGHPRFRVEFQGIGLRYFRSLDLYGFGGWVVALLCLSPCDGNSAET
jgi:hypothetical protein